MKRKKNTLKQVPHTYFQILEGSSLKEVDPSSQAEHGNNSYFFYVIARAEIDACDTSRLLHHLRPKADNPLVSAGPGSVIFSVTGYDEDPRELFQIPEFRAFARRAQEQAPCWIYFAMPSCGWTRTILAASASEFRHVEQDGQLLLNIPENEIIEFMKTQINDYFKLCQKLNLDLGVMKEHLNGAMGDISPRLRSAS